MISCLVLDNVCIYCIITFYCLLPSVLLIHNSDLCQFPHFIFTLLLLLLLLFLSALLTELPVAQPSS